MEDKNQPKHRDLHPPQARIEKTPKSRTPLIGALVLLVVAAGFFVYMWHQMQSQLADQRDKTIKLAQEVEEIKEWYELPKVNKDVEQGTPVVVEELPASEPVEAEAPVPDTTNTQVEREATASQTETRVSLKQAEPGTKTVRESNKLAHWSAALNKLTSLLRL